MVSNPCGCFGRLCFRSARRRKKDTTRPLPNRPMAHREGAACHNKTSSRSRTNAPIPPPRHDRTGLSDVPGGSASQAKRSETRATDIAAQQCRRRGRTSTQSSGYLAAAFAASARSADNRAGKLGGV